MQFTDTHTHLHFDQYDPDREAVIRRAEQGGVNRILTLGTDLVSSRKCLEISRRYPTVFAAAGIHPTEISPAYSDEIHHLREMISGEPRMVAVGEIGLDLYWKEIPLAVQLPVFGQMLALAAELDLPVVIHNRDAHAPMQQFFLQQRITRLRGVMHSFSGTVRDAEFYLDRDLYISFTGVITFKNFKETEVVKSVPLNRLLLETDSPFLTPVPRRGKRNEPIYVKYVAEKLAEIHQVPIPEVASITSANARELFRW